MIEIIILSLIQGITEFIPVSSSSHLILISDYIKFDNRGLSIDVSLHIGSFLGVITFFYKDIFEFVKNEKTINSSKSEKLAPKEKIKRKVAIKKPKIKEVKTGWWDQ